jgi:hypothetical protein
MDTWQQSEYGSFLTFCDAATLADVRKLWEFYATERGANEQARFKQHFDSVIEKAKAHDSSGGRNVITGVRSVIPAHEHAMGDMRSLHQHYWEFKSCELNPNKGKAAKHPNPSFLTVNDGGVLHYGVDPLLGFHLTMAYAPLPAGDPAAMRLAQLSSQREKIVAVAHMEFEEWLASYRKRGPKNVRMRFFAGDAISLAHTLQHKRLTGENTAEWYRYRYGLEPVTLDGPDYAVSASIAAPLEFDVIETSNLCDHMGPLILLTAASPLLRNRASSALYTETLIRYNGGKYSEVIEQHILCGHLPTMTTLLGLFPVEYWTNTSPTSVGDETRPLAPIGSGFRRAPNIFAPFLLSERRQMVLRTAWKRPFYMVPHATATGELCPCPTLIQFDAKELARALYKSYITMFRDEEDAHADPDSALVWYHRGSFAAFLRLVQTRVSCDWDAAMIKLIKLIRNRRNSQPEVHYVDELFVYMHIVDSIPSSSGLCTGAWAWQHRRTESASNTNEQETLPSSGSSHKHSDESGSGDQEKPRDIRDWTNIPPIVCVTLKIPRSKIAVLTRMRRDEIDTPYVHCFLSCPDGYGVGEKKINAWHDDFAACQLAFGEIITASGKPYDDSYRISVAEDKAGWGGASALIAVFYVPTFCLLAQYSGGSKSGGRGSSKNKTKVGFAITRVPAKEAFFKSKLGGSLTIYETGVDNSAAVYITRYAPNMTRFPIISGFAPTSAPMVGTPSTRANASMTAKVEKRSGHIVTFTGRLDITSDELKSALRDGHEVHPSIINPCEIAVRVGQREQTKTGPLTVSFPVFIQESTWKVRFMRKSSWVEVIAHVGGPNEWMKYPYYMYPVCHNHHIDQPPTNYNMPYLSLHACPIIDTRSRDDNRLDWLRHHVSSMIPEKEEAISIINDNNASSSTMASLPNGEDTRLGFQKSLLWIFERFSGSFRLRSRVFILREKDGKDGKDIRGHLLIIVHNLRLNRSDRAVVLDCAVIPNIIHHRHNHGDTGSNEEVVDLWKLILLSCLSYPSYCSGANNNTSGEAPLTIPVRTVDKEVMHLWRRSLPAFVERCRTWTHREDCEYGTSIPPTTESDYNHISHDAFDVPFLCTCGNGVFPHDFSHEFRERIPGWDAVAKKYAVRAAISPAFCCWAPPFTPTLAETPSSPFPYPVPILGTSFRHNLSFPHLNMEDDSPPAIATTTAIASAVGASTSAAALGTDTGTNACTSNNGDTGSISNQAASDQASSAETDGCACCGRKKRQDNGGHLMICTGCHRVKYCSRACQRLDWSAYHKNFCRRLS